MKALIFRFTSYRLCQKHTLQLKLGVVFTLILLQYILRDIETTAAPQDYEALWSGDNRRIMEI